MNLDLTTSSSRTQRSTTQKKSYKSRKSNTKNTRKSNSENSKMNIVQNKINPHIYINQIKKIKK